MADMTEASAGETETGRQTTAGAQDGQPPGGPTRLSGRRERALVYATMALSATSVLYFPPVFAALAFAGAAAEGILFDWRRGAALGSMAVGCGFAGIALGIITSVGAA